MDQPLIFEFHDETDIQDFLHSAFLLYLESKREAGFTIVNNTIIGKNAETGEDDLTAQPTTKLADYELSPDNTFYCFAIPGEFRPLFGAYTEKPMPDTWQNVIID